MAKKRADAAAADADAFRVEGEEEAPKDDGKVDLGDGIALKRALDEAAIQASSGRALLAPFGGLWCTAGDRTLLPLLLGGGLALRWTLA